MIGCFPILPYLIKEIPIFTFSFDLRIDNRSHDCNILQSAAIHVNSSIGYVGLDHGHSAIINFALVFCITFQNKHLM